MNGQLHGPGEQSQYVLRAGGPRLEDILITGQLRNRSSREPNWKEQGVALSKLAQVAATAPEKLVDTLLEMTLQLTGAETSGLSILETTSSGEQIFRWTNLAGKLEQHIGGSTPRDFSPCGVCVDRESDQLFSHPECYFTYFADVNVPFVEALVIPVRVGSTIPGTIWILSHTKGKGFDAEDARMMTELANFMGCALGLLQSAETERQALVQAEKEIAARTVAELDLREIKNELESTVEARTYQLQQLSAKLISVQDDERRRIARELHDSAGQYLAAIAMNIDMFLSANPLISAERSRLDECLQLINRCNSEIRTISYLLHPPLLDEVGLFSAISWYVEGFAERSGIQVDCDCPKDLGRFPSEIETAIFRIVQQGLANIHRHSRSSTAKIRVYTNDGSITVEVSDEGCGIPPAILIGETHLVGVGIAGMRERIRVLGGKFNIRSDKNGTTIEANFPYTLNRSAGTINETSKVS